MQIEKRGNSYRIRKMVKGKSITVSFDHKPKQSEIETALDQVKQRTGPSRTFNDCALEFLEANDGSLSPNTITEYEGTLRRIPQWFKDTRICDMDQLTVQKCVSAYSKAPGRTGKPRALKTVKNYYHFISVVLSTYKGVTYNINVQGAASEDGYWPTEEDIQKLIIYIEGTKLELPFLISAFASLRESEILALNIDDVKDDVIHVTKSVYKNRKTKKWDIKPYPKNKTSVRFTPIPHKLQLKIAQSLTEKGYIYPNKPNQLRKDLKKACLEAGITPFTFHRLRAYYTCAAHNLNVPDKYIMKNGGWKTDTVLKKNYQRALADKQNEKDIIIVDHFSEMMI